MYLKRTFSSPVQWKRKPRVQYTTECREEMTGKGFDERE